MGQEFSQSFVTLPKGSKGRRILALHTFALNLHNIYHCEQLADQANLVSRKFSVYFLLGVYLETHHIHSRYHGATVMYSLPSILNYWYFTLMRCLKLQWFKWDRPNRTLCCRMAIWTKIKLTCIENWCSEYMHVMCLWQIACSTSERWLRADLTTRHWIPEDKYPSSNFQSINCSVIELG